MSAGRRLVAALFGTALAATSVIAAPAAQAAVAKPLDVVRINYDPAGRDTRANAHINLESVVVKNIGKTTLNLTGYRVVDAANHTFVFPTGTKLAAGKTLTIRSGKGTNNATTLYWKQNNYVWNNTGDTLLLQNPKKGLLEKCSYKGGAAFANC